MENTLPCPACAAPMRAETFERRYGGVLTLDICLDCRQIWFDEHESAQLAPDGLINLFKLINDPLNTAPRLNGHSRSGGGHCPRCRSRLTLTHDLQRSNRLLYFRCEAGHGRLTAFYQFLREKNFVRDLTKPEVLQLKAEVKQVRCAGCGAPVDLQHESACSFCQAPISILDANAVAIALQSLDAERSGQRPMDPDQAGLSNVISAYGSRNGAGGRGQAPPPGLSSGLSPGLSSNAALDGEPLFDLVGAGIGLLAAWFDD